MTSIFIGGSRAISKLDGAVKEKLDDFMNRRCAFLIGDANGADRAVQQYLASRGHREVVVYCMDRCRNNAGPWPIHRIAGPAGPRNFSYYAVKDKAMAQDAACGMMIWDGASKGTLNNIQNLLDGRKKVLVYLSSESSFHKVETGQDLTQLLSRCDPGLVATARTRIERITDRQQLLVQP